MESILVEPTRRARSWHRAHMRARQEATVLNRLLVLGGLVLEVVGLLARTSNIDPVTAQILGIVGSAGGIILGGLGAMHRGEARVEKHKNAQFKYLEASQLGERVLANGGNVEGTFEQMQNLMRDAEKIAEPPREGIMEQVGLWKNSGSKERRAGLVAPGQGGQPVRESAMTSFIVARQRSREQHEGSPPHSARPQPVHPAAAPFPVAPQFPPLSQPLPTFTSQVLNGVQT